MQIKNGFDKIIILFSLNSYPEAVIYKCIYWYMDNYTIEVNYLIDANLEIIIQNKDRSNFVKDDFEKLKNKIEQDFFDFKLRQIITSETSNIRDLLIAKAFNPITKQ